MRDIHIEDQQGDTLLQAARLSATIQNLNRSERSIDFNQIILQNARINLRTNADSVLNLQFIIDALASEDTTKAKWDFTINAVHFKDTRLSHRNYHRQAVDYGLNFQDIEINDLNFLVNRIHKTTDSVHFTLNYLNFKEKSGFAIDHFTSENSISASGININNLKILTPGSRLDLNHFHMDFRGFEDFGDFVNHVTVNSKFNPSFIRAKDIAYFAPGLKDVDMEVLMSGNVTGKINNLKGTDVHLSSFNETSLHTDFNLIGLPDISETFIFLDLHSFISSTGDIREAGWYDHEKGGTNIPLNLSALGKLSYSGKFTGFIDDFVAYGELRSDLGSLITDLSLQPDSDNILDFNGRLRAIHFDAGSLAGSDQIGNLTFDAGLKGQISTHSGIHANLEGTIDSVKLFDYSYKHVQLTGELADRKFEGSAYINDPNIILEFLGSIDLSDEIPEFDFSANVSGARLYELKLEKEEPDLTLSFLSTANFKGSNMDNLNGKVSLINAVFEKQDHIFDIENLSLSATGNAPQKELILNSNLADGRIAGNYEFATIIESLHQFINKYIPSYGRHTNSMAEIAGNDFSFNLHIKDTKDFTEFFIPELSIASGTRIEGIYNPQGNISEVSVFSDKLKINSHIYKNITFNTESNDSVFTVRSRIGHAIAGNHFELENINLQSTVQNDSVGFITGWDNKKDKPTYKGNLIASARFEKSRTRNIPTADIDIFPSDIIIADSLWHIGRSRVRIDSTSYRVDNFIFGMTGGQNFKLNGKLSEDPYDSLYFEFINIDLENIELLSAVSNFHFAGIINGNAAFCNVYDNPVIKTDLEINELFLNHQDFGDLSIISQWNNNDRSISIHTFSDRGSDRIINIDGKYMTDGGLLDFDIELNKINLRTLDGYLDQIFADLRGITSGELKLEGNIRQPIFNGNLALQKASFTVDYLKTRYNFTHDVEITNNDIIFNDLLVYDANHNTCLASGTVSSNYFRDFSLDLYLQPDNFMAMNTTERDNEMFYGRIITSGLASITGPTDNILMNISARTNQNTRFFIPVQKNPEVGELHFLTFTRDPVMDNGQKQDIIRYDVDLSGLQLNLDLDVTPEAEVQIIFDSKIGDIIRGRGNGSIKMEINPLGQLTMYGEYIMEQGDYLFTLQNVINKRFDIERGGRIIWNGDPVDATIDLRASYRLRAPLNTLMAPFSNGNNDIYSRRVPVECQIIMKDKLMTPDISFDIDLPTADPDTRRNVQGILNTEEKRNRQFLALLVINNFLPDRDMSGPDMGSSLGMSATEAGITTVSEFFSNQLSNWLSQLSRDVDFGVNWRPGDEITPDEVELALSTQVLNDRVSINGHVDVGGRQTNTSNLVGDFDVDIKLTGSGKLRLKAFTRANDNMIRPHLSPYTQGVGLFYREEFDSFDQLMSRYWNMITPAFSKETE